MAIKSNIQLKKSLHNQYSKKKSFILITHNLFKFNKKNFTRAVVIRVRSNNVFCTLNNLKKQKTILSRIAAHYGIKITAKKLRYELFRVVTFFYKDIKSIIGNGGIVLKIIAPKRLRRRIYRWIRVRLPKLKKKKRVFFRLFFVDVLDKKAFNGCRAKSKRRKKRRRKKRYFKITRK